SEVRSAIKPLLESLKDEHPFVRAQAAISLSDIQADEAVDDIISLLDDKEWLVRENAIIALAKFPSEKVYANIIRMLSDSNEHVVERAIKALGEMKCKKAVPYLSNMLQSKHKARKWAAWALGEIGEGIAALVNALKSDSDVDVRRKAATALGKIGDIRAIDSLEHALFNDEDEVSTRATKALGKIAVSTKEEKAKERIENILIRAVNDDHLDVKLNAILGLGNLGILRNPKAIELLEREKEHDVAEIEEAAKEALKKVKLKQTN
ncbi:MAG: HEAT repeat domain-containing protein, partial [Thermoplasmata archaeon]